MIRARIYAHPFRLGLRIYRYGILIHGNGWARAYGPSVDPTAHA